ncbi:SRPBCC domain-containing protein [Planomonospora sp. ID91781]|uniref:SRPBCC family protein n=1 Tax=Planomonospora sp. ID91781 TaxID=2738135 RepID=UPI0018C3EACE|nr:SRPBCC domain-containing protein [Planomonospora sp. ID91781]MBG0823918.1 SRPBCC domain-containing protein [Planomonospora sp. ID91781]
MTTDLAAFPAVRRERVLSASVHAVYRAWLDPAILQRWLAPGSLEGVRAEVDERPGGRYLIRQTDSDQPVGGFDAQLLELVPDRRIVWRWSFIGPDRDAGPVFDSLLTVTLDEAPEGGTRLTLVHERLGALAATLPQVAEQVGDGWDGVLDRLAETVR